MELNGFKTICVLNWLILRLPKFQPILRSSSQWMTSRSPKDWSKVNWFNKSSKLKELILTPKIINSWKKQNFQSGLGQATNTLIMGLKSDLQFTGRITWTMVAMCLLIFSFKKNTSQQTIHFQRVSVEVTLGSMVWILQRQCLEFTMLSTRCDCVLISISTKLTDFMLTW